MARGVLPEQEPERRPKIASALDRFPEVNRDVEVARSLGRTTEEFYALPLDEQELQIAKYERDRARCPKHPGPRDECSDPDKPWYPQRTICYADMELAAANRMYELLHEARPFHDGSWTRWAEKPSREFPFHARDGVNIWVSPVDYSPDDRFLTDPNAPAVAPVQREGGDDLGDQA